MNRARQRREGRRRKSMQGMASAWIRVLSTCPLVAVAQSTNEIPPLRPPHAEISPTFWEQHTASVAVIGFVLLAFLGLAIWFARRPRPLVIVPPEVQARGELAALRQLPEDGGVLSRISQTVRHYFGTAFSLPPGELTTQEFCQAITANAQIPDALATAAGDFLRRCDERKFAPDAPPASGTADDALQLVDQAETHREKLRRAAATDPAVTAKT